MTDLAVGPTLGELVRSADGLDAAASLRVLHDVASALAALHRWGVVHGRLDAEHVVLRPDGAVLVDLVATDGSAGGSRTCAPERRRTPARDEVRPTAASDVWELATLVADVMAHESGVEGYELAPEVREILEAACRSDPARRPTATRLAEVVAASPGSLVSRASDNGPTWGTPPRDVLGVTDAVADAERAVVLEAPTAVHRAPRVRRRRARARRALAVSTAVAALGVAAVTTVTSVAPPGAREPGGTAVAPSTDRSVAAAFERRDRALESRSVALLSAAVVPGGAAWRRDTALLRELVREDVRISGLHTGVEVVRENGADGTTGSAPGEVDAGGDLTVVVTQAAHRRSGPGLHGATAVVGPRPPACLRVVAVPAAATTLLRDWEACG
ncbi:hypothetical protein GCM10025875_14960 [Litorihabitans aurantiacus]|uniref:Protein kinase domain-containing protein n=1 Tax=Litorihabitans aurantiacus TaxID=1930061 RepID=A0AA37XE71_9MICO|nr:hypothetical protein GCM10025875_14960 [Litorihabitans aurantiacus]